MKTLYLRNVPESVTERLERLAAREGISVSALAIRELTFAARRADNRALLDALPDLEIPMDVVIDALDAGRAAR